MKLVYELGAGFFGAFWGCVVAIRLYSKGVIDAMNKHIDRLEQEQ